MLRDPEELGLRVFGPRRRQLGRWGK
jgi:hypothetical protein